jgi:hypothetical protein
MDIRTPTDLTLNAGYDGMAAARAAVASLQAAGIDAARISIGPGTDMQDAPAMRSSETPLLWRVLLLGAFWSIIGGIAGAVLGLVLGLNDIGVPGTPDNIGIQIASWAMFLHVAGALVGCYLAIDTGDRYASTALHHDANIVRVRVRAQHRAEYDRATEIMRERLPKA